MEITVPRLGWSMEEATFAAWLKTDGAMVRAGEPLFTLESEKATQDVEALDGGVLRLSADAPKPGMTVKVGQCIGFLEPVSGSMASPLAPKATNRIPSEPSAVSLRSTHEVDSPNLRIASATRGEAESALLSEPRVRISPRALRVAAELSVDWKKLSGTGRAGRIRESDIRAAAAQVTLGNLSSKRRIIAARMMTSLRQTAPVTLHATADATAWVAFRTRLKSAGAAPVPSYTDMLIQQVAVALKLHPLLNARWDGDALLPNLGINIGLAVDTEEGLVVPVIREANTLTLAQLAVRTRDLVDRARARRLSPDDLSGGTFTVTSLGGYGIDGFTPIINYPECAILGLGQIRREPSVVGDRILPRDRVTLSLTFDHRAFDGAPAARFLRSVCERLEQGVND